MPRLNSPDTRRSSQNRWGGRLLEFNPDGLSARWLPTFAFVVRPLDGLPNVHFDRPPRGTRLRPRHQESPRSARPALAPPPARSGDDRSAATLSILDMKPMGVGLAAPVRFDAAIGQDHAPARDAATARRARLVSFGAAACANGPPLPGPTSGELHGAVGRLPPVTLAEVPLSDAILA
jgi:hypothetical protein